MSDRSVRIVSAPRAETRLREAGAWLESLPAASEALVIAPNWEAADDLVRGRASRCGALFGIHRMTLNRLAGLLASDYLLEAGLAPAQGLAVEAVTARVVNRLGASEAMRYFAPVIDRPGFPGALTRTIVELRLNRVAPETVRALDGAGAALAAALAEFEAELLDARLADRAGILKAAIDALAGPALPRLAGLPVLFLDIPMETALERDLVAALAGRAPRVFATIPAGDSVSEGLFAGALGVPVERADPPQASSSLARLQGHLFADTAPPRAPLDDSIAVVSAPGEMHECVEVARRIHLEAARGVPFDRVAVLCHAPERYGPYLEEALARAEIPAYFASGTRRPEPGGRALLALLACAAEDLSATRFAEYLSLAQVPDPDRESGDNFVAAADDLFSTPLASDIELPPPALESDPPTADPVPVVEGTLRAPWRWEKLLVDAAVIGSKDRWSRRLAGLQEELGRKRQEYAAEGEENRVKAMDRQLLDLSHLKAVAMPIITRLAEAPAAAAWAEWLDYLRGLVSLAVRDSEIVLQALAELEPMGPVGPVGLDEVRTVLADRLGQLRRPPARRRYGAVFVGTPAEARGMSFDVAIVPGLAERMFPKKLTEDPILADPAREKISPLLRRQTDRVAAERLALRMAAGAASSRAMFSYPRLDLEQGRPRVPSFYALEVLRAAEGTLPGFSELARRAACEQGARLGWPAPADPQDAIDAAEFDLAVLDKLVGADPETTVGAAHYLLDGKSNEHLPRALRARARRWWRQWTTADGLVNPGPEALAALSRHHLSARAYSPTALQHFAACPYRFLLHAIFRLEPRDEVEAIEVLDPLTRGALVHAIQFEVLTNLRTAGLLPIASGLADAAYRVLDAAVEKIAGEWHDELAPAIDRVWQDAIDGIRADLREWLRRAIDDRQGWCPERFELAFGLRDRDQADPASSKEPVDIGGLRLRGSIDLIERAPGGELRTTDHKTGKVRAEKDLVIGGGKVLQPVLYSLAAEKILNQTVVAGRLYYCTAAGGYEERIVAIGQQAQQAARDFAATLDAALKSGFLPAAPDKGARRDQGECDYCDYRRICGPYEMQRTERKPADRLAALGKLREMR